MTRKHDIRYPVNLPGLSVVVKEDFARALRTFSKKVQDSGLLKVLCDNMYYESGAETRTRKRKSARKRWLKKVEQMKLKH